VSADRLAAFLYLPSRPKLTERSPSRFSRMPLGPRCTPNLPSMRHLSRIGPSPQQAAFGFCGLDITYLGNRFHQLSMNWNLGFAGLCRRPASPACFASSQWLGSLPPKWLARACSQWVQRKGHRAAVGQYRALDGRYSLPASGRPSLIACCIGGGSAVKGFAQSLAPLLQSAIVLLHFVANCSMSDISLRLCLTP
jgi:hypothetical protein